MSYRNEMLTYLDDDDLFGSAPRRPDSPSPFIRSGGNQLLETYTAAVLGKRLGELQQGDIERIIRATRRCEVGGEQGIYDKNPPHPERRDAEITHDDMLGVSCGSKILGLPFAEDIARYGRAHSFAGTGWVLSNTGSVYFDAVVKPWHQIIYQMNAGNSPDPTESMLLGGFVFAQQFADASDKRLAWLFTESIFGLDPFIDGMILLWRRHINKSGGMREVFRQYHGPDHLFTRYCSFSLEVNEGTLMSFLSNIFNGAKNIISGATGWLGSQTSNLLGMGGLRGIGADLGARLGENIPRDFSVHFPDPIRIQFGDLVQAAQLFRDGMAQFDLFGGTLRQLSAAQAETQRIVPFLREFRNVVLNGWYEGADDTYFLLVAFAGDANQPDAGCQLTVEVNGALIVENLVFSRGTPVAAVPGVNQNQAERLFAVTNIRRGQEGVNEFKITVSDVPEKQLQHAKMKLSLLRRTPDWTYTVAQWVCDGVSGTSSTSLRLPVQHPDYSIRPGDAAKVTRVGVQLQGLIDQMSTLVTPGVHEDAAAAVAAAILQPLSQRNSALNAVSQALAELGDADPNTFDVRTPFFISLTCHQGPVTASVTCKRVGQGSKSFDVMTNIQLGKGDEIAVQLPVFATSTWPAREQVELTVTSQQRGQCTAMLHAGYEWNPIIVNARTIALGPGTPKSYTMTIDLSNALK